jgi:hypothetical protein
MYVGMGKKGMAGVSEKLGILVFLRGNEKHYCLE